MTMLPSPHPLVLVLANPVLPAPQSWALLDDWMNLRGSFYSLGSLGTVGQLLLSSSGARDLPIRWWGACVPLPSALKGLSQRPLGRAVSGLQGSSICRVLADFSSLYQPNIMPRWIHHLTKAGCIHGRCKTCFWVKSSAHLIYLFIGRKPGCISWGKENMIYDLVGVRYCLPNNGIF